MDGFLKPSQFGFDAVAACDLCLGFFVGMWSVDAFWDGHVEPVRTIVGVDTSVTLSSAVTSILSGVFLVLAGTSTVTVGLLDAVSACFVPNTPVAPATESATRATTAMDNPAVCGFGT